MSSSTNQKASVKLIVGGEVNKVIAQVYINFSHPSLDAFKKHVMSLIRLYPTEPLYDCEAILIGNREIDEAYLESILKDTKEVTKEVAKSGGFNRPPSKQMKLIVKGRLNASDAATVAATTTVAATAVAKTSTPIDGRRAGTPLSRTRLATPTNIRKGTPTRTPIRERDGNVQSLAAKSDISHSRRTGTPTNSRRPLTPSGRRVPTPTNKDRTTILATTSGDQLSSPPLGKYAHPRRVCSPGEDGKEENEMYQGGVTAAEASSGFANTLRSPESAKTPSKTPSKVRLWLGL
jgi:hypothetical protein